MKIKILIIYASFAGSTAEVATAISEILIKRELSVDIKPIKDNPKVEGYQAVLIGSAVHHGRLLPETIKFIKSNKNTLASMPVTIFCLHIQNLLDDEQSRKNRIAYLDDIRPYIRPVEEVFFAGKFDRRGAALLLPKWIARFIPPIDLRKWKTIRNWALNTDLDILK